MFRLSALEHPKRKRAEIEPAELMLILEGIDLAHAKRRKRFAPRKTA